jgi:hypothetical protein
MVATPGLTPQDDFAAQIADLKRQIQELKAQPLYVPVLQANPDTSYAGNMWADPSGVVYLRLKNGTIRQVATTAASAPTGTNPTPPAQPITRQGTWTCTWAQAYRNTGAKTGGDNRNLYYGNSGEGSYNGRQKSLINFDYATIAATLAGSTVSAVELYLYNIHTWANSGATCWIGSQGNFVGSAPGGYGGAVHDFVSSFHTARSTAGWHTVSTEIAQRIRDGNATGVTLEAPNDSTTYYGYAAGIGSNLSLPQLRVTYIK